MELNNEFRVDVPVERAWEVLTNVELIAPCMPGAQLEEVEGEEYRGGVKIKVGPITAQYKGKATFLSRDPVAHKAVLKAEGRDTKGQGNAAAIITATMHSDGTGTKVQVNTDLTITGRVAQFGRGVLADVSGKILGQFVDCLEHNLLATPEADASKVAAAGAAVGAAATMATATMATATMATATTAATTAAATTTATAAPTTTATATAAPSSSSSATSPTTGADANGAAAKPTVRKIDYKAAEPVDLLDAAGTPVLKRLLPAGIVGIVLLLLLRRLRRG
jgi:uncharacterized protein